jgi:hypothetical protein
MLRKAILYRVKNIPRKKNSIPASAISAFKKNFRGTANIYLSVEKKIF